jgi:hypothetical protein
MFRFRAGVTAVAILVAIPSFAQESALPIPNPRFEVSFGYQGRVPVGSATSDTQGSFGASFGWVSRGPSVALVVLSDTIGVGRSDLLGTWFDYSVLAGPRLRLRAGKRVQPYTQLLSGVSGSIGAPDNPHPPYADRPGTAFQVAPGVGLDLRVSRTFTLRLVQVEYRSFTGGDRSDRFTVSSGVVFGLAHRKP